MDGQRGQACARPTGAARGQIANPWGVFKRSGSPSRSVRRPLPRTPLVPSQAWGVPNASGSVPYRIQPERFSSSQGFPARPTNAPPVVSPDPIAAPSAASRSPRNSASNRLVRGAKYSRRFPPRAARTNKPREALLGPVSPAYSLLRALSWRLCSLLNAARHSWSQNARCPAGRLLPEVITAPQA